uniref:Xrn1 N-terminal domain-containing protein n=1 Tax=viral metagenome TaxID=1070528 RepID=A0A6C0HGX9_9ZZZZ
MGIPFYYVSLIRQHRGIVKPVTKINADILALDFNCLIHKYLNDSDPIESVLRGLELVMTICSASRTILYLDGLVPYAKMVQQRYRRFRKTEPSLFDRTQISPDTPFMRKLEEALKAYPVEVSGTLKAGEGEQKLFRDLKKTTGKLVVYGLDADLILLSVYHSGAGELMLLRESQELHSEGEFSVLLCTELAKVLPIDREQYLYLCVLCFGNDFMPNLGLFSLREGGYQRALDVYSRVQPDLTTEKGRYAFLKEAGKQEWNFLSKRKEKTIIGTDPKTVSRKYGLHILDGTENMEPVVSAFWKTFHWTVEYFKQNKSSNWNWVYPYPDAPLITDILEFYETESQPEKHTLTLAKHLAFILPAKSLLKRHKKFEDEWHTETRPLWIKKHEWESKPFMSLPWHPTDALTSIQVL